MNYSDLNNDDLPIEQRLKHLEREAGFVRDFVKKSNNLPLVISTVALVLSLIAVVLCAVTRSA